MTLSGGQWRALSWSVAAGAGLYLLFALWGGGSAVLTALEQAGLPVFLAALGLSLVNYGLRFWRWQQYLRALGHPLPTRPSLGIWLAGFALTTTPGKAGEAIRSLMLKPLGVPYPQSLAAFVAERLSDLLAIVLLALAGLALHPDWWPLLALSLALVLTGLGVLGQPALLARLHTRIRHRTGRGWRALGHGLELLLAAGTCFQPRLALLTTAVAVVSWAAEALALHLILLRLGLDADLLASAFIYAVSMLAGALSFLPGGLGGTEASMVGLLLLEGLDEAAAVAATLLIRLATLWFAVLLGLIALATLPGRAGRTGKP